MNTMTGEERKRLIEEIMQLHAEGDISLGMAIRRLRLEVTGFDQETFARMCSMSTRALYQLETDKGNPTLSTVDSILRKFGLRMGLMKAIAPYTKPSPVATQPTSNGRAAATKSTGVSEAANAYETNRKAARTVSRGAKPKGAAGKSAATAKSKVIKRDDGSTA